MPRLNYAKNRNRMYTYRKGDYADLDNDDIPNRYPRFRNDWHSGKHGHRNQPQSNISPEVVRRVVVGDLPPSSSYSRTYVSPQGEVWVRANIANGASMSIDFLKESFSAAIETTVRIYNLIMKGENCTFFFKIRSKKLGDYCKAIKSIINPVTGAPIVCDIKSCSEPEVPLASTNANNGVTGALLPEAWMAALRECFKERFQATTNVLDLSSLHTDLTLLSKGYFIPLNKTIVFSSFIAILQENDAKLSALNLSNNRLNHVQPFEDMCKVLGPPTYSFERIDLSGNHINTSRNLEALKAVPGICHLDLSDTPIAGRLSNPNSGKIIESSRGLCLLGEGRIDGGMEFVEQLLSPSKFAFKKIIFETPKVIHIGAVGAPLFVLQLLMRELHCVQIVRILPGLKTLNGNPIKVTVRFAIEQGSNAPETSCPPRIRLPPSIQGHFGSEEIRVPLLTFLMEYFGRYDAPQRGEGIYSYYTPASTLTICVNPASQSTGKSVFETLDSGGTPNQKTQLLTNNLDDAYYKQNRNLMRCKDENKRHEFICQGPLNIASALGKLPATEHILESFCVDVINHSENQIIFNVTGVFYENKTPFGANAPIRKVLRCFARSMILIAPGTQILQDSIIISNPTEPLIQRYIREVKKQAKAEAEAKARAQPAVVPQAPVVSTAPGTNEEAAVVEFRRQTGMNSAYCRQCLQEFGWQFETALAGFRAMHASGSIPQIAFAPDYHTVTSGRVLALPDGCGLADIVQHLEISLKSKEGLKDYRHGLKTIPPSGSVEVES
ncbi:Nuclear RNA export factor [Echinococcus granulosus]|uniref:Nuclear RNA export factor n=1 Tax=Echinococcus granulosus TaxID=6210 RepID=W6V2V6_ECHGR|nr:Nuclear RNA export factor [Echinococcus granulosus]EUB60319.1 Nuclear RNA export factor [Echinococcus granulosus]